MQHVQWTPAYIALGSNLAEPATQVKYALKALAHLPATQLIRRSSLYESQPMGPQSQPMFINAVAALLTQQTAQQLLIELQQIEKTMGRLTSSERWGPRVIDLDILMFGETQSMTNTLQLPHPGMLLRDFVMQPLAEIAPHLAMPNGASAAQVAQALGSDGLQRLADHGSP
jgi:2-amino-4-hydroxy-6-hydroxymethyldihydropteridine diphosphokinase